METEKPNKPAQEDMPRINMRLVEELTRKITRRRITVTRFRFNMEFSLAFHVLAAHYSLVVKNRHGNPVFDANTQQNLIMLAMALGYTAEIKSVFATPKYSTMEELTQIRHNSGKTKAYRK